MGKEALRILYLGLNGPFSQAPLAALLAAGHAPVAVVVPAEEDNRPIRPLDPAPSQSELRLLTPYITADTLHLAWANQVPVFAVSKLHTTDVTRTLAGLQADVACVACFPWRIPPALLALPPHGFLNLHPSLLPAYRGPYPLFWTFRDGVQETGVTLHYMDEKLDTGDIALQAPLSLPDGISGPKADRRAGEIGGQLLVEAIPGLIAGTLPRRPQPAGGNYYQAPKPADFRLSPEWPGQRAFNFMRGTAEWAQPYLLESGDRSFFLAEALACFPRQQLDAPYRQSGREVWLQFTPGVLRARLA